MPSPILAKALKAGDTIAFVSLSLRVNDVFPLAVTRAITLFEDKGYKVKVFFTKDEGIRSSINNRLAEFKAAFLDPEVSAIICTIGGGSFTELLPALVSNKDLIAGIRKDPKIVVGFSDNTGLHWFLHACTGLRSFYGPTAIPELGVADSIEDETSPLAFCAKHLFKAISVAEPLGDLPRSVTYAPKHPPFFGNPFSTDKQELSPAPKWKWLRQGKAQGRLFGGCLNVMVTLNGIPSVRPDWSDRIVFFETSAHEGNDVDDVRAYLGHLIAGGVFDKAAGVVIGRPYNYDTDEAQQQYENVLTELLCNDSSVQGDNKFPILFNVDVGHTTPMVTLPMDAMASLDSEADTFSILESGVK